MTDLALVTIDDLIIELGKRADAYVVAVARKDDGNKDFINTWWSDDKYIGCLGLTSALDADIKEFYNRSEE